jgi:ABC-2 type transport system permease protein
MSEGVLAQRAASPSLRPRPSVLRIVGNEAIKGLLTTKANWGTIVPGLAVLVVFYFFVQFLIGSGRLVPALYAPTLLGFSAYAIAYIVSLKTVAGTLEEMNAGTLEQVHLSPLPSWALSFGRLVAAVVEAVGMTALVSAGLILVLGVHFSYRPDAVVPLALTIVDVAGFSLLLGALAIRVASIGAILHVLQGVVLLLNGAFVPVSVFPDWLQLVSRLLPTTLGVEVSRRVLLQGWPLSSTWSDHSLLWLMVHSGLMLILGSVFYQRNIMRALHEGTLGPR